jgi:CubicO group peptidase (beta-lactamase class C family)
VHGCFARSGGPVGPGQVKKWGLTFLINTEDVEGFRSAGSPTWGGVHNTYFWIDLKKRITAVALMQILPIGDLHVKETMIAFEWTLYAEICENHLSTFVFSRAPLNSLNSPLET